MFAARIMRLLGLTLALGFLSAGFTVVAAQEKKAPPAAEKKEDKKDDKKKTVKGKKLTVILPQEDAQLTIEKDFMKKPTGVTREFEIPEVEVGKIYLYDFKAFWEPNNYTKITRTKTVEFKGGDDVTVDLSKLDPKTPDSVKIRWVPTPDDIVEEMMKLGGVKEGDVVYEPGPGDGRVLIAAAKHGAKKAVGIEIDPEKAAEANENVKKAKVGDKVKIIEGDALKDRDYSEASVIMLYMGNEFNKLLLPILEKQLKPGTRIVSHRFVLGDWAPDKTIKVMGVDGDEYVLHLWTVKEKKK